MKKKTFKERFIAYWNLKNVRVNLFLIALLICYLSGLSYYAAARFNTADPIPHIEINMEEIKQARYFTVRVKTGLFIKNIPVFDEIRNSFRIEAIIWFEFDPSEIMLETVEKFSFDNGFIVSRSTPDVKIDGEKIFAKYDITFEVMTDLRHDRFPFDDHRLSIILTNNSVTPDELVFVVEKPSFQIAPAISVSNWRIYDANVHFGYTFITLDEVDKTQIVTPKALFLINFAKASMRKIIIVFLPIFAACFLTLFSFLLSFSDTRGRFSLAMSGLTALLGYRFVIEQMMPKVSYFTTTDHIYFFLLIYIFSIFALQLLFMRWYGTDTNALKPGSKEFVLTKEYYETLNNRVFLMMIITLFSVMTYILLF